MKFYKRILFIIILLLSLYSCNDNRLSKKEYNRILDSLKQIEVPLLFDSIRFFDQRGIDVEIDSMIPEGIIIHEKRDAFYKFHRHIKHKDSLFWDVFDYDQYGHLQCYYKNYFYDCGNNPTGYVICYNDQGEVDSFYKEILVDKKTGKNSKTSIYDIINKLKGDGIDLLKHDVYICFTDWTGKREEEEQWYNKYYWIVIINYYSDYETEDKEIKHQHKLRISPDTGEVLEDWIEKWE